MSTRKTNLLVVLGICLSILLPAQFCKAQLSVKSFTEDEDHIGWVISTDNTDCKRQVAADRDYEQKGGTFKGLPQDATLYMEPCGNNQYGCYAILKGTYSNGHSKFSYVNGTSGATTREEAIEKAREPSFVSFSVVVAGCIPKPPEPAKPALTTSSGNWSEWINNDCFSKLSYQYHTKALLDLTPQFHYYFQAKNDYPVTVYFILSLKDADGRERFGTRHTIPPGGTIQFVEKMDKDYIRSMAIERVRFKSDVGDYAACGDDPASTGAAKTTPAKKSISTAMTSPPANTRPATVAPQSYDYDSICKRNAKLLEKRMDGIKFYAATYDLFWRDMHKLNMEIVRPCMSYDPESVKAYEYNAELVRQIEEHCAGPHDSFECTQWGSYRDVNEKLFNLFKPEAERAITDPNYSNELGGSVRPAPGSSSAGGTGNGTGGRTGTISGGGPSSSPTQNTTSTSQPVNTTPATNTRPTNAAPNNPQNAASATQPVSTNPISNATPITNTPPAPSAPEEYFHRGNSYAQHGSYDLAIADYSKAIQANPNYADAYFSRGTAYGLKGSYDLAIADLTKGLQIAPNSAEGYNNRAFAYYRKGIPDLAIADSTKAIQIAPDYWNAYSNRGMAYAQKDSYDLAIADYTKSIQIYPHDAETFYRRGLVYTQTKSYDQAIADYTKAIQMDPSVAEAFSSRGLTYALKESYDLAIADYTRAIQIKPDAFAYYYRGVAYAGKGGSDDLAIADLTKAIQIKPDDSSAYYARGVEYSQKGSYDLAIADYTKAIQINPNDPDTYTSRGSAYASRASYDLAIADYTKAAELDPKNPEVNRTLAWTYLYAGKPVLAHQKAAAYLELNGLAGDSAPYAIIVGYLGLFKSGDSAKANEFLSAWLKQVKPDAWTTNIMHYFHSEITSAQLLALATDNDKLTEAHTYIGEIQLVNKTPETAKVHFEWVRNNGNKSFFEYTLSIAEIRRLSQ